MTREEISLALTEINTSYIEDAMIPFEKKWKRPPSFRKITALAAALLLLLACSVSALATADVQPAYQLLYAVSPSLAQTLKPVRQACEDEGIRMEVISASVEGNTALIYISMQDLESDRIDATTDLFDSYDINRPFSCSATCRREYFDADTNTAYFLIQLTQWNDRKIGGKKITFSVSEFLSKKQEFIGKIPEINLGQAKTVTETQHKTILRGGTWGGEDQPENFLIPSMKYTPVPGANITAYGFVDGKLHIQVYYENILETDNHGGVWLQDNEGNTIDCEGSVSFWDREKSGSYEEYVFPVSSSETLSRYSLWGDFTVCGSLTKGNWEVTFPLEG